MDAVDRGDSAQFTKEEVLKPSGWILLNFLMDARTGLGRFRDFRVSNYQLMMHLIDYCRTHTIEQILELPDVKERVEIYFEHEEKFVEQLKRCGTAHGNVVLLDLREEDPIWAGNRFMVYALFPEQNVSIHEIWGKGKQNTVFAIGRSILNRTSKTNVGELCLAYGGGGHEAAGTCQVENKDADRVRGELIAKINADG
jgi:nanoRNase/pAp phosphatase (c-di-AMP/oligoRNAs hydrolase)